MDSVFYLLLVLLGLVVVSVVFRNRENFCKCGKTVIGSAAEKEIPSKDLAMYKKACRPGDPKHCPQYCSPFLYPDMYSPLASCSDSLNWGFTYSTGRCPHAYYPQPRRLPSPPTFNKSRSKEMVT